MYEYSFKVGTFYFRIHAETKRKAVTKARRALEESFSGNSLDHLDVQLTAGAFLGRLYIELGEITVQNIIRQERLPKVQLDDPF